MEIVPNPFANNAPDVDTTNSKLPQPSILDQKLAQLRQASAAKTDELRQFRDQMNGQVAAFQAQEAADAQSLVGRLGLDPDGAVGTVVNLGANVVSGASRMIGQVAALPFSTAAIDAESHVTQEEINAYNKYVTGKATAEDLKILDKKKNIAGQVAGFDAAKGSMNASAGQFTASELLNKATAARNRANRINEFFDISSIENASNKRQLSTDLGEQFQEEANKISSGWEAAKGKRYADAAKGIASGIAGLLVNAGEAAFNNPTAIAEYVANNAPQLLIGAAGTAGKAAMTATNVGYAADYYQKGIDNYQAQHDGQMPSLEERHKIAGWAASLALAEQLGDKIGLDAMKLGGKEAVKLSAKRSLLGIGSAAMEGTISEALTEGYQTFAEGKAQGKDVSAKEIYEGAVIGGLSGGVLSGGVRTLGEATKSTPEHAEARAEEANKAQVFQQAVAENKPEVFLDKESKYYDPAQALNVIIEQNRKEDIKPEDKLSNVRKAVEITDQLDARKAELLAQTKSADKEEAKAAVTELAQVNKEIVNAQKSFDVMHDEYMASVKPKETESTPEETINLSMASRDAISANEAVDLANNTEVEISDAQRDYLRTFSDARQAENALSSLGKVSQEILYGTPKNVGINQYRQRIGTAILAGNEAVATKQLEQLQAFAEDHAQKALAARQAISQGMGTQIIKAGNEWLVQPKGTMSDSKLRVNGGLAVNSPKLVQAIQAEAKALEMAHQEMSKAVAMTLTKASAPVESKSSVQATATDTPSTPVESTKTSVSPVYSYEESRKEEARLEKESPEPVALEPQKEEKVTQELPKKEAVKEVSSVKSSPESSESSSDPLLADARGSAESSSIQVDPLGLKAKESPKGEKQAYNKRNLIADEFTQQPGSEDGTQRPLATTPDFLSVIKKDSQAILLFLASGEIKDTQERAVATFIKAASDWAQTITDNFVRGAVDSKEGKSRNNPDYYYNDMVQFLINEDKDTAENVKTAISYAAFSWVAENASKPMYNTNEEINAILLRDEDALVNETERSVLGLVGSRESVVINSLGQRIVAALGLKAKPTAPKNLQAKLEADLGAHALKLLLDREILTRTTITGSVMGDLMKSESAKAEAQYKFIALNRNEQGVLNKREEKIKDAVTGSQGILDKIFSVESAMKEPSFEPIKFNQKTTRNTDQTIPESLVKIMEQENSAPWKLKQDMWQVVSQLSREAALGIAGVEAVNEDKVHTIRRFGLKAKNDGLEREYDNAMSFFSVMPDTEQEIFFDHSVWKQQRVGIATNMINPQSSKIHRHMLARNEWNTEIKFNDTAAMNNFKLRVAEGLGVKTDKQTNVQSLVQVEEKLAKPEIKDAIDVLKIALNEGNLSADQQSILLKGVKAGGENFHTLDALTTVAFMDLEQEAGKDSFTTTLMGEVDGVTNGPMLSNLLMGAANTVNGLYSLLNRGGFFEIGNAQNQYNVWRSVAGHLDLYETTTSHMMQHLNKMDLDASQMKALYYFTGNLTEGDKVVKAGRDIIKTPLTAMVFGSSVPSAVDSMADKFVEGIYAKIEDLANGKGDRQELLTNLNKLGIKVDKNMSVKDMLDTAFTKQDTGILKDVFKNTIGKAVEATMEQDFEQFLERRTLFNQTAQLSFELYNAAYQAMREEYVQELIKSGDIAVDGKGNPIHDLSSVQEKELKKRTEAITPVLQTAFSKESNQPKAGLYVAKTERKLSDKSTYTGEVQFAKPFADNGATSVKTHAYERVEANPGVAMAPMSIHSTDSAISHHALSKGAVLNVHDAHGAGLGNVQEAARNLNQATWDAMLNYSPATEVTNTFLNVVTGLTGLMKDDKLPENIAGALAKAVTAFAAKLETNPLSLIDTQAMYAKSMAYEADNMKLQALERMAAVDQYALEGGNYEVTDQDRAAAAQARSALQASLSGEELGAVDTLSRALKDIITKQGALASVATKGKPQVASDMKLVKFFKDQPLRNMNEVVGILNKQNLTGFQQKLVASMSKILEGKNFSVQYVTPETTADRVIEAPKQPSHAWFVSKGGYSQIYVLSPDFKESGLTVETLIHEMMHATVAQVIANPDADAKALVDELEAIRIKAAEIINSNRELAALKPAVQDVQELVAYGMSNAQFQTVLAQINIETKNGSNKWISGLKSFIDTLISLVFGKQNYSASNGLSVLITNVTGLMKAASAQKKTSDLNQSMASGNAMLTTTDLYEALGQLNNQAVDTEFDAHLRTVLDTIVTQVHGPYGSFSASMQPTSTQTPADVFAEAIVNGNAPFAAKSLQSGYTFTEQEAFVMEQVEASVRTVLDNKDGTTSALYQELARLYKETKDKLKPSDFPSQALYDFVFTMEAGADNRADYLSRFTALGLGNKQFNDLLGFNTETKKADLTGLTLPEKLAALFEQMMTWINGKLTHTFEGQQANNKLESLVQQLVNIENRKRSKLIQVPATALSMIEDGLRDGAEKVKANIAKVAESKFFKQSTNNFVRATGSITTVIAKERVDQFLDNLQTFRDSHFQEKQGLLMATINEIRGSNPGNQSFYTLLRATKHNEGIRQSITNNTTEFTLKSFKDGGKYLTESMKKAITAVAMRTDMSSLLDSFTMADIQKMVTDRTYLNQQLHKVEKQLDQFKHADQYSEMAQAWGYFKATGLVKHENLLMNPDNIANMFGTVFAGKVDPAQVSAVTPIIDQLMTLYALHYTDASSMNDLANVMAQEATQADSNGIEFTLRLHQQLQQDSKERLFKASGALWTKGYTPEVYNPYISMKIADERTEGPEPEKYGYKATSRVVQMDKADPNFNPHLRIYTLRDGGLPRYQTGTLSMTGMAAKGSEVHNGNLALGSTTGLMNQATMGKIKQAKTSAMAQRKNYDPERMQGNHLAPVLNPAGDVVNYRYMMNEENKDTLLERENRFEHLIGTMAGSIFDKETTASQNQKVIQALHDQYKQDFTTRSTSYVKVGADSTDPELREIYRLLPEVTKQDIRKIWGSNNMMVRIDLLDINFGYRKNSVTDMFNMDESERNLAQKMFVDFMEAMMGKKAGLYLRRGEDIWQALVKEAKDILVVKSGVTLAGNFFSNLSELIWFGVPMADIVKHHRVALKGFMNYKKDTKELAELELAVKTNQLNGRTMNDVKRRMVELNDSIARSPVKELIDAGMMPTIVEDVEAEGDQYSYKSRFAKQVDSIVGNIHEDVLTVGKYALMTHDTALYQVLGFGTQVSDFMARYTLYQHMIHKQDAMNTQDALQLVSDAFVNYDVPSHRNLQYMNDMGMVYFSKYYLRIQKVIALLYRQAPGRALMLLTAGHFMDFLPMLTHSSMLHRLGNPFSMGAFESITAVDDLATVNALMSPFR